MKSALLFPVALLPFFAACEQRQSVAPPKSQPQVIQPRPVNPDSAAAPGSGAVSAPATAPHQAEVLGSEVRGTPLPETAYQCTLILADIPAKMKPGAEANAKVTVTNNSTSTWPVSIRSKKPDMTVAIGYHWETSLKKGPGQEGPLRGYLPATLAPGMSAQLDLPLVAPAPGTYTLRIEPVHENVTWFSWKNGCFKTAKVIVAP